MIQIERVHFYPVPLRDGFTYITDLNNWGDYWPNFVRIKDPTNARWSKSGDTITLVLRPACPPPTIPVYIRSIVLFSLR
jgi:hypothetical protein